MAGENWGKMKVPTLRNVGKGFGEGFPKAYGHNGYFKSLKSITHFYNTRDVTPTCPDPFTLEKDALSMGCWPAPEVAENVNTDELGNLGLTAEEEDALVAFMMILPYPARPTRGTPRSRTPPLPKSDSLLDLINLKSSVNPARS
jgi:cytochrome c peroxidase